MRRILARLAQAGLVEAREGRDGGYSLKLPPDRITLADVFRAVSCDGADEEDRPESGWQAGACEEQGDLKERLDQALIRIMSDAERRALEYLQGHTIASLV